MSTLTSQRILDVGMGFWPAKVLLTAVELGLFTTLGDAAMTAEELRAALHLHARSVPDFPDALVALGFLLREGDGPTARYRNTRETATFLDGRSPGYIGGFLEMANARLYPFWGDLTEALRTGKPQNELKRSGVSLFEELYRDPARLEQFINGMSGISMENFRAFAEVFDFSEYHTLCDVGGASALLSCLVAARHPHMRCTTLDLPVVVPIAQRRIVAQGLADRVSARALDFFAEPVPPADVVTMGMILHDWDLERKLQLIRAAHAALPAGGAFVAIEHLIDDARRENAMGLMMSLNMVIETGDGFDFTGADFAGWCREVGFRETRVIPLTATASAAVAYK